MMKVNLNRLQSFVAVVNAGSLTGAAAATGQTKAMVSTSLKNLESELGCTLLTRTTRRIALTEVGQRFYQSCLKIMEDSRVAIDEARENHATLSGELRVTSTVEYGLSFVTRALADFADLHPTLKVEFTASSGLSDLVLDQVDLAIRLGRLSPSGYRATRLWKFHLIPISSPEYMEQMGGPPEATNLARLNWVQLSGSDPRVILQKVTKPAQDVNVTLSGSIRSDSALAVRQFVLLGKGAAILPDWMVAADINDGRLVRLCPDYYLPELGVFAIYPNTKHVPAKVRKFIDYLRKYPPPPASARDAKSDTESGDLARAS